MDRDRIQTILNMVSTGEIDPAEAFAKLRSLPYEDIGIANVDLHRSLRQGMPEVIFCPGKTADQITHIAARLRENHKVVLASRATAEQAQAVLLKVGTGVYHVLGQMLVFGVMPEPSETAQSVAIVTAGTADLHVAEEAALVLQAGGVKIDRINDVGVAGIHRLLDRLDLLRAAATTIVIAGMDGALPSVVAGLLEHPVIAVPTSIGYGASFQGVAALLTMLNSCAAGLTVVNIDNGFGAAMAAIRVMRLLDAKVHNKVYPGSAGF
jgi:pyridinium-3,5-biscarboxylic acid mononucleotide synthase